jgi:Chromo (CHRromatin Organisation MOdifier) domain
LRTAQPTVDKNLSSDEFVIDRFISHAQADDGSWLIRVRWAGFGSSEDTWEPAANLPKKLVDRYCKRRKLNLSL